MEEARVSDALEKQTSHQQRWVCPLLLTALAGSLAAIQGRKGRQTIWLSRVFYTLFKTDSGPARLFPEADLAREVRASTSASDS